MIYYNSSQLSGLLTIPTAKWKRWSREFLPVDPLSGLQSGFARQFNLKDAFRVYLGGECLVGMLRLSIAEARQVLSDLNPWLKENGYFRLHINDRGQSGNPQQLCLVAKERQKFGYAIREYDATQQVRDEIRENDGGNFSLTLIGLEADPLTENRSLVIRVINMRTLYNSFLVKLRVFKAV